MIISDISHFELVSEDNNILGQGGYGKVENYPKSWKDYDKKDRRDWKDCYKDGKKGWEDKWKKGNWYH